MSVTRTSGPYSFSGENTAERRLGHICGKRMSHGYITVSVYM